MRALLHNRVFRTHNCLRPVRMMSTQVPRPLILEFYKKVHPDLFVENENHRRVNQDSLASLNSILDYADAIKDNPYTRPPASQTLSFFLRASDAVQPKLVQVQFNPISGRDVFPSLDRCLFALFKEAGIEASEATPEEEPKKPTENRSARRREAARKAREAAEAEDFKQQRELFFGRKQHKSRRLSEPRFCLVPAMLKSGLIEYSSKLQGWQKTRAIIKLSDTVNGHYTEMQCNEWTGCKIFFHHHPEFFEPTDGTFIIPWDFQPEKLVHYFKDTAQLALDDTREKIASIDGPVREGQEGQEGEEGEEGEEEEGKEVLDPEERREVEEAFTYFTTPHREEAFDELIKHTMRSSGRLRTSPEETAAIREALSNS